MMKKVLFSSIIAICAATICAQEYNAELNQLTDYVKRMYFYEPFEGVRIIEDENNCYLISAIAEAPTSNTQVMNRKAEVKALSAANTFINGAILNQKTVLYTKENSNGYSYDEIEDYIESRSMGYIQTMQLIANFDNDGKKVFIYCKKMPMPQKSTKKNKRK